MKILPLALATLVLAGCASAPRPLQGDFAPVLPADASAAQRVGDHVRWGGSIVAVTPAPGETCFEVLGRDLGDSGRPLRIDDNSAGRFLACRPGFYDPAIFEQDREVTITGRVAGYEQRRIGEYDYTYPRVAADVVYLWPERRDDYDYFHHDPFWPAYRPLWWGGGHFVPVRLYHHRGPRPQAAPVAPPPSSGKVR